MSAGQSTASGIIEPHLARRVRVARHRHATHTAAMHSCSPEYTEVHGLHARLSPPEQHQSGVLTVVSDRLDAEVITHPALPLIGWYSLPSTIRLVNLSQSETE